VANDDDQDATPSSDASTGPSKSTPPREGDLDHDLERALVERAQAGDQRAFRELYLAHARPVFRCAIMPLVRNRDLAEDLLSETFVRAMRHLPRFVWQGKGIRPWLMRIAKNLCLDHLRKAGRVTAWPEGFEQQIPDLSDSDAEQLLGRAELSDVLAERIRVCLDELNPRYRRVIELRIIQKQARTDAAAALDVTIGTLDVLLFRACKSFRKVYTRHYGSDAEGPKLA